MKHVGIQAVKPKARPIQPFLSPGRIAIEPKSVVVINWRVYGSGAMGYGATFSEAYAAWAEHYMSAALYGTGPAPRRSVLGIEPKHHRYASPIAD